MLYDIYINIRTNYYFKIFAAIAIFDIGCLVLVEIILLTNNWFTEAFQLEFHRLWFTNKEKLEIYFITIFILKIFLTRINFMLILEIIFGTFQF